MYAHALQESSIRKVEDLRAQAEQLIKRLRALQEKQLDAYSRYLFDLPTNTLASDYTREIRSIEEQLDLLMAEYRRRHI